MYVIEVAPDDINGCRVNIFTPFTSPYNFLIPRYDDEILVSINVSVVDPCIEYNADV